MSGLNSGLIEDGLNMDACYQTRLEALFFFE